MSVLPGRIWAVLVTYKRPKDLRSTLACLLNQTRPPDRIVVVDNAPTDEGAAYVGAIEDCCYLPMPENLGPAGGLAAGVELIFEVSRTDDWILFVDDDDPPRSASIVAELVEALTLAEPSIEDIGGVGCFGPRYNRNTGMFERVPDGLLRGLVDVDYLAGGSSPIYRVEALREVGPPEPQFFWGFDDAELGLRLRAHSWRVVAPGDLWLRMRTQSGRLGLPGHSRTRGLPARWRRYYAARNSVVLARRYATYRGQITYTALRGVVSPVRVALKSRSVSEAWPMMRGAFDGLRGNMGRTLDPP